MYFLLKYPVLFWSVTVTVCDFHSTLYQITLSVSHFNRVHFFYSNSCDVILIRLLPLIIIVMIIIIKHFISTHFIY